MSRPRLITLIFPLLLVFFAVWGIWAVVSDNQPTFADGLVPDADTLMSTLQGKLGLTEYVEQLRYRPPLSHIPSTLLFMIGGWFPDLTLARLGVLLQHLLLLWVGYNIGVTAAGRGPGLLAAALLGTTPMVFGWGRLAYMDTGLALMVLVCLRLLMNNRLARPRDGLLLGLAAGGGMLTKVAFPIFAMGPLVWLLALRVRSLRAVGMLGLAVATTLGVISWWLIPNMAAILTNAGMSSTGSAGKLGVMAGTFKVFVIDAPWGTPLMAAALVAGVAALILRPRAGPERPFTALLLITLLVSTALLCLFQPLLRYMVPVYAVAALLCGTCLGALIMDRAGRAGWPIVASLVGLLLVLFVLLNLGVIQLTVPRAHIVPSAGPRVSAAGMLAPDTSDYGAVPHLRQTLGEAGFEQCLVVANGPWVAERAQYMLDMFNSKERRSIFHSRVGEVPRDRPFCLLLITGTGDETRWKDFSPQTERGFFNLCRSYAWLKGLVENHQEAPACASLKDPEAACRFGSWDHEPLDLGYFLFKIGPNQLPEKLPMGAACKLDQVDWEEEIQPENASSSVDSARVDPDDKGEAPADPPREDDAPPPEPKDPDVEEEAPADPPREDDAPPPEPTDPDVKADAPSGEPPEEKR